MVKGKEIIKEIEKSKGTSIDLFAKKYKLEINSAREILDYAVQCGIAYQLSEKEYDIKELAQFKKDDIEKFEEFVNKFFSNITLSEKIKFFTDKKHLAQQFLDIQPLYYDKSKIWWLWDYNIYAWKIIDETDILNAINLHSQADTINSKQKAEILEGLKQVSRENKPKEIKKSWIQFKDKIYDIETNEIFDACPDFFVSNPIPHNLGKTEDTPFLDNLFISWVGEEKKEELYEILAFSIVPLYFIHRIICLIGSGANGKTTFLKILRNFIGGDNVTSSSIDALISNRFAGAKLFKRLVCIMGETNFNTLSKTDYLKKLSGEDIIDGEIKNKDLFNFDNYAKLIMATNSLPMTTDKTEGFYRRWKIIDFPNKFDKEIDILKDIPSEEYSNLALKCLTISKKLWKDRIFTNEGDIESRKRLYEAKSNPLMLFIKQNYEKDINGEIIFKEFYELFSDFLNAEGYRHLTNISVAKQLRVEGFDIRTQTKEGINAKYIFGLNPKVTEVTRITETHIKTDHVNINIDHGNSGNCSNFKDLEKQENKIEIVKIKDNIENSWRKK